MRLHGTDATIARFRLLAALAFTLLLAGCPHIQLVAHYDATTYEETIRVGKSVDLFYANMLEVRNDERVYAKYADKYNEIEADIRSLVRRNAARQLNQESRTITEDILGFWQKYRCYHKNRYRSRPLSGDEVCDNYDECREPKDDKQKTCVSPKGYPAARLDRNRFSRLFNAVAAAEEAKKLQSGDRVSDKTDGN